MVFVFIWLLLCMGSFVSAELTSGLKKDGNMTIRRPCSEKEGQTLLGLKANLVDINNHLHDWKIKKKDCCKWVGVNCNKQTGHVTELDFSVRFLELSGNIGSLLPSLSLLSQLQYLDLSGIDFQLNHIPSSLSSLTNLRHLNIHDANLTGSIPHQLANLSNLIHLDLGNNFLSGQIPDSFGDFTSLAYLDLSRNQLQGVIPKSFGYWTSLEYLDLTRNRLEGVIPICCGNSSYLGLLDLSRNHLNGSVPDMTECSYLRLLDLSRNGLTGNLPNSVGKLLNLKHLDVSYNSLEGLISDDHFLNLTQLTYLDLSFNSFALNIRSHTIFPSTLNTINMQSCKLGPSFPMWLQTQRDFSYLDISNAGISDHIPGWFWDLPRNLKFLNLSSNEIKGVLPDMTSVFYSYPGIDLSNNQLEGKIPVLPSKLAALNLSGNRFSGTLSFLCQIDVSLTFLDVSNNLLSGSLPDCLLKFHEKLVVLNLSNNSLSGEIPSSLGSLSQVQALYLRQNAFVGEIPMSLRNCTKLRFVDLGENKLSGNIPPWIGESLSELYVLVLRANRLDGSLPSHICLLSNLQFLDLSTNGLSGNIPRCFGNFTAMVTRDFQDNVLSHSYSSFEPVVPMPLGRPCSRFESCVPNDEAIFTDNALVAWKGKRREFGRGLYLLKSIDISRNKLYGELPDEITNLLDLVSLSFSHNKLSGQVPKHMGQLKFLESLDLSRNEFSGNIPPSLSHITSLSYLDLSYNNLSGKIPLGPQLQLFGSNAYIGNPQLCGLPLTQICMFPPPPASVDGKDDDEEDGYEFWKSYYTGMGVGFVIGFLSICGALSLNRHWRHFFFASLYTIKDWMYVIVVVHFRNLQTKFTR